MVRLGFGEGCDFSRLGARASRPHSIRIFNTKDTKGTKVGSSYGDIFVSARTPNFVAFEF